MADFKKILNTLDSTSKYDPADVQQNKWVCALSYIFILFFLPLVVSPKSKYGKFHANQALVLLLVTTVGNIALEILGKLLSLIFLGFVGGLLSAVWGIVTFLLMVLGIWNVLNGRAKELPIIGVLKIIHVK